MKLEKKQKKQQKKEQNKIKKQREKEKNQQRKAVLKQKKIMQKQKVAEEKARLTVLKKDPKYKLEQQAKKQQAKETAKQKKVQDKEKAQIKKAQAKEKKQALQKQKKDPQWQQQQKAKKAQEKLRNMEKKAQKKEKVKKRKEQLKQKKAEEKQLKKNPEWVAEQKQQKQLRKETAKQKKWQKKEKAKADKLRVKEQKAKAKAGQPSLLERIRPKSVKQGLLLILILFVLGMAGGVGGYIWLHPDPDVVVQRHLDHLCQAKNNKIADFFPEPQTFIKGKIMSDELYQPVQDLICEKIVDMDYTIMDTRVEGEQAVVTLDLLNYDLGGAIETALMNYQRNTLLRYVSGKYDKTELEEELVTELVTSLTAVKKEKQQTVVVYLRQVEGKWQLDPLNGNNLALARSQTGYIYKGDTGK